MREFDVIVVGAGIAGLTVAKDLAVMGKKIMLVEREPYVGGRTASIGSVFPTMGSGRKMVLSMMEELRDHISSGAIDVTLQTMPDAFRPVEGGMEIDLTVHPRHVNDHCAKCGECSEVCPVTAPDHWDNGLVETKAIRVMHRSWPIRSIVDMGVCTKCGACLEACVRDAIDLEQKEVKETVKAKAIVLATGLDAIDVAAIPEFGRGISKDVITTIELERLLSEEGPTQGRLLRPSDSRTPKVVVFAQCVGSRVEKRGVRYCCSVGCLNAVKNAKLIMERNPGTVAYVCYIDMRTHGRGYEEAYKDARMGGVRFVRGQPSLVRMEGDHLLISGENTLLKELYDIPADLLVLCPGLETPKSVSELAKSSGLSLEEDGLMFVKDGSTYSEMTSMDRVFLAGSIESPKDVKDALLHARACAQSVLRRLDG